ncbi:MAG: inositol monophosphatase [Clostridiales bacterium]|nr:inositol monophosphatase [Clostridiales bacterium]
MREKFEQIIREAAALALESSLKENVHSKGKADFVTDADLAISKELGKRFAQLVPGSRMLSEEDEYVQGLQGKLFIVDPVDGTTNLMYNLQMSAVSAAYLEDGKLLLGAIYNPFIDEMFMAELGKGAFLNGSPIRVNDDAYIEEALLGIEANADMDDPEHTFFEKLSKVLRRCRGLRWTGSAALDLAYVACGRLSGVVFQYLHPWDYAAGWLILNEAGGTLTTSGGQPPDLVGRSGMLLASNAHLHEEWAKVFH